METTRLSTKGQIVLPKAIRASRSWMPGTEFIVEEAGDGVLLRPAGAFPETDLDTVAGCLRSKGQSKTLAERKSKTLAERKSKTLAEMDAAIRREVTRRHDRGRY